MNKKKLIKRPDWTISNNRKLDKLWLDKNENFYEELLNFNNREFKKVYQKSIASYPDLSGLYKELSKITGINSRQLIFTSGSDGGIRMVYELVTKPKDKVLILDPTFAMYEIYAKIFQNKLIKFSYKFSKNGPNFDFEKFIQIIKRKKPKLICLPNPNSPTGTLLDKKNINDLIKICKNTETYLLIDEAYYPICDYTVLKYIKKFNKLIIVRSFSKAWGLAGLRVGYIISNQNIIKSFHSIKPMYEIGNFSAEIVLRIIKKQKKLFKIIKKMISEKNFFLRKLNSYGFETLKSNGNFLHVNFGKKRYKIAKKLNKFMYFRLEEKHKSLKGYSRISLTSKKNYLKILNIVKHEK